MNLVHSEIGCNFQGSTFLAWSEYVTRAVVNPQKTFARSVYSSWEHLPDWKSFDLPKLEHSIPQFNSRSKMSNLSNHIYIEVIADPVSSLSHSASYTYRLHVLMNILPVCRLSAMRLQEFSIEVLQSSPILQSDQGVDRSLYNIVVDINLYSVFLKPTKKNCNLMRGAFVGGV